MHYDTTRTLLGRIKEHWKGLRGRLSSDIAIGRQLATDKAADSEHRTTVYVDGSRADDNTGGWAVVLTCIDGHTEEFGGGLEESTIARMELYAALEALYVLRRKQVTGTIDLFSDCATVVEGMVHRATVWKKHGWTNRRGFEIAHADLWEKLLLLQSELSANGATLNWKHVRGHTGVPGNVRCNQIARLFARRSYMVPHRQALTA